MTLAFLSKKLKHIKFLRYDPQICIRDHAAISINIVSSCVKFLSWTQLYKIQNSKQKHNKYHNCIYYNGTYHSVLTLSTISAFSSCWKRFGISPVFRITFTSSRNDRCWKTRNTKASHTTVLSSLLIEQILAIFSSRWSSQCYEIRCRYKGCRYNFLATISNQIEKSQCYCE